MLNKRNLWVVLALAALAAQVGTACGGNGGSGSDADGDSDSDSDGDSDTDGDTDTDTDADVPYCIQTCESASDCVPSPASGLTDENNYNCNADGNCEYTGCNTTDECQEAYSSDLYECTDSFGYGIPVCKRVCDVASDCSIGTPLYDTDNYTCNGDGFCEYTGCNDTTECEAALPGYVCAGMAGSDVDVCQLPCGGPEDCGTGTGAYDEDNYDCVDDLCVYTGCNSQAECKESNDEDWTCYGV
jgi:hypothetical protein